MIEIHPIANYPELMPEVCDNLWREFGENYIMCMGMTDKDDLLLELRSVHLGGGNRLPMLIAVDTESCKLVGVCNMVYDDLGSPWNRRLPYSPWLANVIVLQTYRHQGWGTKLVQAMLDLVTRKKICDKLYLWNISDALTKWYKTFGFEEITSINNFMNMYPKLTIMVLDIGK